MKCPRCKIEMVKGKILVTHLEDGVRYCFSTPPSKGELGTVMKCPQCGHSEESNG